MSDMMLGPLPFILSTCDKAMQRSTHVSAEFLCSVDLPCTWYYTIFWSSQVSASKSMISLPIADFRLLSEKQEMSVPVAFTDHSRSPFRSRMSTWSSEYKEWLWRYPNLNRLLPIPSSGAGGHVLALQRLVLMMAKSYLDPSILFADSELYH